MQKTKISWCDYTINPVKGLCLQGCFYCYARRMYKRFKWNEVVRFDIKELNKIAIIKNPSKIFICSTHDLFGKWVKDEWIKAIIIMTELYPQHTFMLLTKNPVRMSMFEFPKNCWLGVTETGKGMLLDDWQEIIKPNHRFISFEPLLAPITQSIPVDTDLVIIGAMTGAGRKNYLPKKKWVDDIVNEARHIGAKIHFKDNLETRD